MDNIIRTPPRPPFAVRTSGCVAGVKYHSTPGTKSDDVMLTAFIKGAGCYRGSGGTCRIGSGMVGLVRPADAWVLAADPEAPYTHYYCRFNGDYAKYQVDEIIRVQGRNFFAHEETLVLANLIRAMGTVNSVELPVLMGHREELLVRILLKLLVGENRPSIPILSEYTITNYLNEVISKSTDLDAIASDFAVSKSSLCRIVKKCCGNTVQKIHEGIKISWAKTLLESGLFNVGEVALRVGYADPLYFSRVFKTRTGKTPRSWRVESSLALPTPSALILRELKNPIDTPRS